MGQMILLGAQRYQKYALFEAFSHIIRIFGSIEPETGTTFPFPYNIIFETYQFLLPPTSTWERHRHVHPQTFLCGIQFSTTFN